MPAWVELAVASRYPEFAEEVLTACGAQSVTMTDAADVPVLEPAPGKTPLWPATLTCGLFAAGTDLDAVRAALADQLPDGAEAGIEIRPVAERDWLRAWLDHAQPMRFGPGSRAGLWICPSGHTVADADATIVHLDPGLAFGTGTHPSTALCLHWLAEHRPHGRRVLDFGCGSGILAIAALRLGARAALGVDIDPQALLASRDNAIRNGVGDALNLCDSETGLAADYDLVLANILARPLIALAPKLTAALRSGGRLVLAGLLDRQAEEVRAAYEASFRFDADGRLDGWSRLSATKI